MNEQNSMSRRDFLRISGGAVSGIAITTALSGCVRPGTNACEMLPVLEGYRPKVTSAWIAKGEHEASYDLFKQVVEGTTDFSWLSSGDKVLLKLSINSGNPFPATTDPWTLDCMIRLLKEKGVENADIFVGDQSGVEHVMLSENSQQGSSRDLCASTGLLSIITDHGVTPCFFEERGWEGYIEATLPQGFHHWSVPMYITNAVEDVDHIIYLSRVASHVLSEYTSAMKMGIGFLRDDSRLIFHQGGEDFYAMYEEVNAVEEISSKLRLVVTSGRKVLSTFGPDNGFITEPDHGLLIASEDFLANDILGFSWLRWNYDYITSEDAKFISYVLKNNSTLTKRVVTNMRTSGIKGGKTITPTIPRFNKDDIYCHPSMINYMERKGGFPEEIVWQQLNSNPDSSIEQYIKDLIEV